MLGFGVMSAMDHIFIYDSSPYTKPWSLRRHSFLLLMFDKSICAKNRRTSLSMSKHCQSYICVSCWYAALLCGWINIYSVLVYVGTLFRCVCNARV